MAITKIPISLMSAKALADHVVANMGLDVNPHMGLAGIKAKMSAAGFQTDTIELDDGQEEVQIKRVEPKRERHTPGRRMVQIRIEPQEKPGGNEPVFASVNGSPILIPRGKTCWVDYKYYHNLMNAVAHIAEVDADSNIVDWRKVPEYPVSVFHIEPKLSKAEKAAAEAEEAARLARLAEERDDDREDAEEEEAA